MMRRMVMKLVLMGLVVAVRAGGTVPVNLRRELGRAVGAGRVNRRTRRRACRGRGCCP
jgi:hypothetical protein